MICGGCAAAVVGKAIAAHNAAAGAQHRRRNNADSFRPGASGPPYAGAVYARKPARTAESRSVERLSSGDGGNRTRVRNRVKGSFYERIRRSDLVLSSPRRRGCWGPASEDVPGSEEALLSG